MLEQLGPRLRKAREEAGISQENAAHRIGLTTRMVWRYERGQIKPPLSKLAALAALYGKPVAWFFEESEEEVPAIRD